MFFFNKIALKRYLIEKKSHRLLINRLFCFNHTCYCVNMVSVTLASRYITSASRYHPRFQSRSSMSICGLIPRNFAELAEAVPIDLLSDIKITLKSLFCSKRRRLFGRHHLWLINFYIQDIIWPRFASRKYW